MDGSVGPPLSRASRLVSCLSIEVFFGTSLLKMSNSSSPAAVAPLVEMFPQGVAAALLASGVIVSLLAAVIFATLAAHIPIAVITADFCVGLDYGLKHPNATSPIDMLMTCPKQPPGTAAQMAGSMAYFQTTTTNAACFILNTTLWEEISDNTDVSDLLFPNVGNLADSNARAMGGIIVFNDVEGGVKAEIVKMNVKKW